MMEDEREEGQHEFEYKASLRKKSARDRTLYSFCMVLILLIFFFGLALSVMKHDIVWLMIFGSVAVLAMILLIVIGHKKKVHKCPFCGYSLFKSHGTHCAKCGEKIRF